MKKWSILLLIGFLFLGLTLSVLAAGPDLTAVKTGRAGDVVGISPDVQEEMKSPVTSGPLAARLAAVIGHDGVATSFLRRLIGGVCGFFMVYTQLGFAFLGNSSRTKSTSHLVAVNILVYSVGTMAYQVWLFLTRSFIPRKEQAEVCYVS